jgi:hypothetical protein
MQARNSLVESIPDHLQGRIDDETFHIVWAQLLSRWPGVQDPPSPRRQYRRRAKLGERGCLPSSS